MSDDNPHSANGSSGKSWAAKLLQIFTGEPKSREELVDSSSHSFSLGHLVDFAEAFHKTLPLDLDVAGVTVRAGETVACLMGSANRDPAAFEAADTFDVGRDPNPHVGFGMGLHFCLGAPLARVELEITVRRLLDRFPTIALHGAAPRRPTWVLRGYESLEVTL